jgi:hypothetical protein
MLHQRVPVHEQRLRMRKSGPQLIENGKAMRVDIPPVVDRAFMKPMGACETFESVARAEDGQAVWNRRQGQEIGFIFSDENPRLFKFREENVSSVTVIS